MTSDVSVIRELAREYREITEDPIQARKREHYRRFNDLEPVGPMVLLEPDGDGAWKEIITENMLLVKDPFLRDYEFLLRRMIFHARNFHDDQVFEPYVSMDMEGDYTGYHYGKASQTSAWGISLHGKPVREDGGAYALENFLQTPEDFETFLQHKLDFIYDRKATERKTQILEEALDGILAIKLRVPYSVLVCSLLIELVHIRDMTSIMLDLYDQPDMFHRIMRHMSDGKVSLLFKLEREHRLVLNNDNVYTGSGGTGYSSRLPAAGFDPEQVRLKDIWGFADAQEFAQVSNEMFKEFVLPYQRVPLELFGLACYGCCEPVDHKLDDILTIPNLWRVSVSPWSDIARAAEKIGRRAIYSRKPNPAQVSIRTDREAVKKDVAAVLDVAKDCNVEFVLKDLRTCNNNPENLSLWVDTAQELCSWANA